MDDFVVAIKGNRRRPDCADDPGEVCISAGNRTRLLIGGFVTSGGIDARIGIIKCLVIHRAIAKAIVVDTGTRQCCRKDRKVIDEGIHCCSGVAGNPGIRI